MITQQLRTPLTVVIAISFMTLTGCVGSEAAPSETPTASPANPDINGADDGCSVHLFDSDNFDESDDNFILRKAGKYESLSNLPGAEKDWTDEADSIRVGPDATVTIWSHPDFKGQSMTLKPGSDHPELDSEPSSIEMTC